MKRHKYTSFMCQCNAVQKVLWSKDFLCIKKLPYGSFFLGTTTFGHNTFCTALHLMKMGNFNYFNYKIIHKNNLFSHVDTQYRQIPWEIWIFSTHRKSEKKLPHGSFFMHRKSFDHSTFCTALRWHTKDVYLCHFIYPFVKIILADLWITY